MACATCSHTMHGLGHGLFWCPRCGTVIPADGLPARPMLVERCRRFEDDAEDHAPAAWRMLWRSLGVAEAINRPEDRPQ